MLDSWNEIGRKLTAMAEDFPEDKYDFKPTPAQRSFAEQLLHAAGSMYYFTNPAMGQKPPAAEDPKRDQYKTKADIVAFVKKSVADGAAAIQSKGEKGLMQTVVYGDQKARVLDMAYGLIEHSGEHYGQLVVYYRLQVLCRRSLGPRSKAQETRYPVLRVLCGRGPTTTAYTTGGAERTRVASAASPPTLAKTQGWDTHRGNGARPKMCHWAFPDVFSLS